MSEAETVITKAQWEERYRPIRNPLDSTRDSFGPAAQEIGLLESYEDKYVWSVLWDFYEERHVLAPGFHAPSESDEDVYYVTEIAWQNENISVIFPYE